MQSLAGRTALITLLPFSIAELRGAGIVLSRDEAVFNGFLPRIYSDGLDASTANEEYYKTYVERDVRQLVQVGNQSAFELFLKLLAGRVGQVVNFQSLAGEVGVDAKTLKKWMSVLEVSYIVFHLQPYYRNFGKRLVKSPKVMTPDPSFGRNIEKLRKCTDDIASGDVIYSGEDWPLKGGGQFFNYTKMSALLAREHA